MELARLSLRMIILSIVIYYANTLDPIYHIQGYLTENNEVYLYSIFSKVNRFYKQHMTTIITDYTNQFKDEDIRLVYAPMKTPSSLRRKTQYMLKPFYKKRPYLNDIVRCTIVFKSKKSLFNFYDYFNLKYGRYIKDYDNLFENKAARYKSLTIKYSHTLFYFSMNVYTKSKCFMYPFLEIQLQLSNHFNYQSMTHWLYDGYRGLKIIELNYNKPEFFVPFDYINDTMSIHPIPILHWINKEVNKPLMSNFELLFYKTKYYLINKMHFFINKPELRPFKLRYLVICRMFLKINISNDNSNQRQFTQIALIKQSINNLLLYIHNLANSLDGSVDS